MHSTVSAPELQRMIADASAAIRTRLGARRPAVGIVLGSGMGFLADELAGAVRIPYRDIPGFPLPTVQGHGGELVVGTYAGREVIAQSGRFHMYEGHGPEVSTLAVRVFAELGVRILILTNAAGGIRRNFTGGTLMLLSDHLNLTARNPLVGAVMPGEERFPDMSDPYDAELRAIARDVSRERRVALAEGVYAALLGPTYETPAEVRMLERLGADAVGMSTAVEVIAARARGMRCLAISTITNLAAGISPTKLSHAEVMETAERVKGELGSLIEAIVERLPQG